MSDHTPKTNQLQVPFQKLCECGCGQPVRNRFVRSHNKSLTLEQRFWEKVDKRGPDDCWEWTGVKNDRGRGLIRPGKESGRSSKTTAPRVSWEIHFGPIPDDKEVCHDCDNPACVNPAHLWLGTHSENMNDMFAKGRGSKTVLRGEKRHNAKVTDDQVREIRRLYASGMSQAKIGRLFGMSQSGIQCITKRKSWKHIE